MGTAFSDLLEDPKVEVKDQIKVLEELGNSIMDAQSERMQAKALEDTRLPIVAIVDTLKNSHISAHDGVGQGVNKVVDNLFNGDFLKGLKNALTTAVNTFLGNAEAGRDEMSEFYVVFEKNALLRVEVYCYKYQFSSEALKKHGSSMFCYVAQIAVLDAMTTNSQVILYEVTKSIGDKMEDALALLEKDSKFVEKFMEKLKKLKSAQKKDNGE